MFLVRRDNKIRLISFKSNPWLKFEENVVADNNDEEEDPDIYKQALFMFSGWIPYMPSEEEDDKETEIENTIENRKRFCRRFNNDKIQCA